MKDPCFALSERGSDDWIIGGNAVALAPFTFTTALDDASALCLVKADDFHCRVQVVVSEYPGEIAVCGGPEGRSDRFTLSSYWVAVSGSKASPVRESPAFAAPKDCT
jgi:hypothetical protein